MTHCLLSFRLLFYDLGSFSQSPDDTSIMTPLLANSLGLTGASHKSRVDQGGRARSRGEVGKKIKCQEIGLRHQ